MADAIYTQAMTYRTPAGVKVSVGDLVMSHRGGNFPQYVGIVTSIKRYGTGRWQICYELLGDNDFIRTTWGHTFGKYEYSLKHFNHKGA